MLRRLNSPKLPSPRVDQDQAPSQIQTSSVSSEAWLIPLSISSTGTASVSGLPWVVAGPDPSQMAQSEGTDQPTHLLGELGGFDLHKSSTDCLQVTTLVIESHATRP